MGVFRSGRCARCGGLLLSYVIVVVTLEQLLLLQHMPADDLTAGAQLQAPVPRSVYNATNLLKTLFSNHSLNNASGLFQNGVIIQPPPQNQLVPDNLAPVKPVPGLPAPVRQAVKSRVPVPVHKALPAGRKEDTQAEKLRIEREAELEKTYYRPRPSKVNPYQYDFALIPRDLCNDETQMLVIVHSFHPYADRRKAIRATWGRVGRGESWPRTSIGPMVIRLAFILGEHKDPGLNDMIREEAESFNDVIIGTFMDSYNNMTLKSLLGLKFFTQHCPHAQVLVKSDDDMVVNLPFLLNVTQEKRMSWSIMGPLNRGSRVYRTGKWKLTPEQYPFKYFPAYESGATYIISADLVPELYEMSEYVPSFFIDDVYITGILGKILNVTHVFQKGFAYWTDRPPTSCAVNENLVVSGTRMTPDKLYSMWRDIEKNVRNCPTAPAPPKPVVRKKRS